MDAIIDLLIEFITLDIFIGYGLYTLIGIIIALVWKKDFLKRLDCSANQVVGISGILYLMAISSCFIFSLFDSSRDHYWGMYWVQSLIWILISQLLWIKKIRTIRGLRFIFAVLFIFSIERYIIVATSFHKDYLPSSWHSFTSPIQILFGLILKAGIFILIAIIYQYLKGRVVKASSSV